MLSKPLGANCLPKSKAAIDQTDIRRVCSLNAIMPNPMSRGVPIHVVMPQCWDETLVCHSTDSAQKLCLQDEFADLVMFRGLVCLVVLPPHHLFALFAADVPDDVLTGRHVSITRFSGQDVDYAVEKEGLAVLTTEILRNIMVSDC